MKKHKVLILGSEGLLGRTFSARLLQEGYLVVGVDRRVREISNNNRVVDVLRPGEIIKLVLEEKPNLVINCINMATIAADMGLEKGYTLIQSFFLNLYRAIDLGSSSQEFRYIHMGTTGSGGLGLSIPFTHGGRLEDMPIIKKAAFAGMITSMLTLLSRSVRKDVIISEFKPGLAIFNSGLVIQRVHGADLVCLDGGESGLYTYNEFALLSSFMASINVDSIVEKAMRSLSESQTQAEYRQNDVVSAMNSAIINPDQETSNFRVKTLKSLIQAQGVVSIIATGDLGPPNLTRDLLLAHLYFVSNKTREKGVFYNLIKNDPSFNSTMLYIKEKKNGLYKFLKRECSYSNYLKLADFDKKEVNEFWQLALVRASVQ